jgi:2-(1,2-epoxy-1,2-dihydrophenyl)acetyl-CoA isomerase
MDVFEIETEFETVNLLRAGAAAKIELNRPDSLNAWNGQMSSDLFAAYETVRDDDEIRAVVIGAAGRAFCSGADLKDGAGGGLTKEDGLPDLERSLHERYHPVITGLRRLPKPVISAVQGPCVGVGLSLALCADLVYATENAYFLLAFVNIGLVPDGGSSALIPARIGLTRATEMAMLGERIDAAKAADWGLINGVIEAETFDAEIEQLSGRLAGGPTRSYAGSKRQLNHWIFGPLDDQLALEASIQQEMAGSSDFAEGVLAFVQKRATSFTGR